MAEDSAQANKKTVYERNQKLQTDSPRESKEVGEKLYPALGPIKPQKRGHYYFSKKPVKYTMNCYKLISLCHKWRNLMTLNRIIPGKNTSFYK